MTIPLELTPMRLSRFAVLYWHEGEWEKNGAQCAIAWSPLAIDAPKDARASIFGDRVTFYDHTGNKRLGDVSMHDSGGLREGIMIFLGDRYTGLWYELYGSSVVYRESAEHWFQQWRLAKNTRIARAMNAVMVAWDADQGIPVPTIADLSLAIRDAGVGSKVPDLPFNRNPTNT